MKKVALVAFVVCMVAGFAQANLIINGDFSLDDGIDPTVALGWNVFHSGG